jgi:hypothetical protein
MKRRGFIAGLLLTPFATLAFAAAKRFIPRCLPNQNR